MPDDGKTNHSGRSLSANKCSATNGKSSKDGATSSTAAIAAAGAAAAAAVSSRYCWPAARPQRAETPRCSLSQSHMLTTADATACNTHAALHIRPLILDLWPPNSAATRRPGHFPASAWRLPVSGVARPAASYKTASPASLRRRRNSSTLPR